MQIRCRSIQVFCRWAIARFDWANWMEPAAVKRRFEELWREIGPCLDAALALEPAERQAWMAALETGQPAVAAKVRSILLELGDLEEQGFLDVPAASMLAPITREGQLFGAYTLDRTIGHGGMGTVWLAHRSDGRFEGEVAIKLLNASLLGLAEQAQINTDQSADLGEALLVLARARLERMTPKRLPSCWSEQSGVLPTGSVPIIL
jgi:hypothetical protein